MMRGLPAISRNCFGISPPNLFPSPAATMIAVFIKYLEMLVLSLRRARFECVLFPWRFSAEQFKQSIRIISNDAVNACIEKPLHFRRVINCPNVYFQIALVSRVNKFAGYIYIFRYLESLHPGAVTFLQSCFIQSQKFTDLVRTRRSRH